jgi:hypothetical protein
MLRLFFALISFGLSAMAKPSRHYPVHLDFEAPSRFYELELRTQTRLGLQAKVVADDAQLEEVVQAGKRNLDWLIFINQHRDTPLSFTVPGSLGGIPIDKPKKYSGALTVERYQKLLADLPPEMRDVLTGAQPFTENPPIVTEDYLRLGNEMDKIYQTAVRWKLMLPYLSWYTKNKRADIRGYHFLKDWPELAGKLSNWSGVAADEKAQLREWLLGECFNTTANEAKCEKEMKKAEANSSVGAYHAKYQPAAKRMYEEFFKIGQTRPDVIWRKSQPDLATLGFQTPERLDIQNFLAVNIEDEWKWNGWNLKLDFHPKAAVHVEFQAGVTPHVNGLAGDTIVMDENAPLTEWDVQWTIRHEFGHVLGLPDCYVEFYDPNEKVMVSYQIDITDLMCSRAGRMKERIFNDMKSTYLDLN